MGGRGARSKSSKAGVGVRSLTDKRLASEIDRLGKVMEETAQAHVAYLQRRGGSKADSDRYRKAQPRYSELQNESMRRLKANSARNAAANTAKPKPAHTFVNGFGEATTRYITSGTYDHALQRTEREFAGSWEGVSLWVVAEHGRIRLRVCGISDMRRFLVAKSATIFSTHQSQEGSQNGLLASGTI